MWAYLHMHHEAVWLIGHSKAQKHCFRSLWSLKLTHLGHICISKSSRSSPMTWNICGASLHMCHEAGSWMGQSKPLWNLKVAYLGHICILKGSRSSLATWNVCGACLHMRHEVGLLMGVSKAYISHHKKSKEYQTYLICNSINTLTTCILIFK